MRWQECFGSLLDGDGGQAPSGMPRLAAWGLPVCCHPPPLGETFEAIHRVRTGGAWRCCCHGGSLGW